MNIDQILVSLGADPLMEGPAAGALRKRAMQAAAAKAREMLLSSPPSSLKGWKPLPQMQLKADSQGRVVMTLPEDFLMLLTLRLSNWERPVRELLEPRHWLYRLQSHRWSGLRGTPQRPLAFFTADAEGNRALEMYSANPGETVIVAEGRYMPVPAFDEEGNLSPEPPGEFHIVVT